MLAVAPQSPAGTHTLDSLGPANGHAGEHSCGVSDFLKSVLGILNATVRYD